MPKVLMPQLGESVAEGTIGKWLKNIGDHVDKYEPIVEVITDKVNAEVPSPFEGTLTQIIAEEGTTVPNNAEIAVVEGAGEGTDPESLAPQPEAVAPAAEDGPALQQGGQQAEAQSAEPASTLQAPPAPTPQAQPAPATQPAGPSGNGQRQAAAAGTPSTTLPAYEGPVTPAVRRLAREHGVDLNLLAGTGHGGRITREDVQAYVERQAQGGGVAPAQPQPSAPTTQPSAPGPQVQAQAQAQTPPPSASAPAPAPAPSAVGGGDSLKPLTPMRKAIAAQMTRALQAPVAYTTVEADMSGVVALRESVKRDYQEREGIGLSFVAFVTKAAVEALRRHPDINGHWTDEGLWRRQQVNVGIAVAVEDGLVVPVIRDADRLSIHGLNQAIVDLAERARSSRLRLDDIQGGTFTVDNTGWTGSLLTQPILNVPEVAIMTMEIIEKRPRVIETPAGDAIAIRPMMNLCLGFDHRATDGAQAGRFVADVKGWLESVDSSTAIW